MDTLSINLKPVTKSDIRFLYNQLKERDSTVNISHKKMPTYSEHSKFILSNTYSKWYIIMNKNKKNWKCIFNKNKRNRNFCFEIK